MCPEALSYCFAHPLGARAGAAGAQRPLARAAGSTCAGSGSRGCRSSAVIARHLVALSGNCHCVGPGEAGSAGEETEPPGTLFFEI